jgi:hypothetical protein
MALPPVRRDRHDDLMASAAATTLSAESH